MSIKSLLHFDSANVVDEVQNGLTWSGTCLQNSNIAKFGTGCLTNQTLSPTLPGYSTSNVFVIEDDGQYEFEFFLRAASSLASISSWILSLNGVFYSPPGYDVTVAGTSSYLRLLVSNGQLRIMSGDSWINGTQYSQNNILADDQWHHILLRIKPMALQLFLDGVEEISTTLYERDLNFYPTTFSLNAEEGIYIDEFVFRDSAGVGVPTIPTRTYSLERVYSSTPTTIENSTLVIPGVIQLRGGTSAIMTAVNPLLARREIAVEVDTGKIKVGDGDHYWNNLPYAGGETSSSLELPASDNNVYVMKNGQWVQATLVEQPSEWSPAIDETENIVLTMDEDMTPYQLTGTNLTT